MKHLNKLIILVLICICSQSFAQNALNFDGIDDGVNCGHDTAFNITGNAFTVEAWIRASSWKANIWDGSIVVKEDNNNDQGFMFRAGNGGKLGFAFGDSLGNWNQINTSASVLSLNTWHHVAATYDSFFLRLYVDGSIVDSVIEQMTFANSVVDLTIGYHHSSGRHWLGDIDEVRLWSVAKTASELSSNKDDEYCGTQTGLLAYYKFDHGTSGSYNVGINTAQDYSGGNNTAQLDNFSLSGSSSNWVTGAGLSQSAVTTYDTISSCNPFYDPVTQRYYSTTGTMHDTLTSIWGCDSAVIIDVTILGNSNYTIAAHTCDSFISPDGTVYYQSGTYYNIYTNSFGCDSIITIQLVVGADTSAFDTAVCTAFTSPSGKIFTQTGVYKDTLISAMQCDSVITINLIVFGPSHGQEDLYTCDSILSPSGTKWYTGGNYIDTLINHRGCDSIIQVAVTDLKSYHTISPVACDLFTSPSGKEWTSSGIYMDTMINSALCDSVITVDLIVNKSSSVVLDLEGCRSVNSPTNLVVFESTGTYFDTLVNASGCDSFVRMNITVHHINTVVTVTDYELKVVNSNGAYQWLRCDSGYKSITNATLQTFENEHRGIFAVEITENNCLDTSACYNLAGLSVSDLKINNFSIYPNPSSGAFHVISNTNMKNIFIYNIYGALLFEESLEASGVKEHQIDISHLPKGNYRVVLENEQGVLRSKMVVLLGNL